MIYTFFVSLQPNQNQCRKSTPIYNMGLLQERYEKLP